MRSEGYIDKLNYLNFLQHTSTMNSMKLLKIYLGKNPDNINPKDLEKENKELENQIAFLSVELGLYKSLDDYYKETEV